MSISARVVYHSGFGHTAGQADLETAAKLGGRGANCARRRNAGWTR